MRFVHTISTFRAWCRLVDNGERLWSTEEIMDKIIIMFVSLVLAVAIFALEIWFVMAVLRWLGVNI